MKKFNQLAKKNYLKIFLSSIKSKVAIKFPKKPFFFSAKNRFGTERVKGENSSGTEFRIIMSTSYYLRG